MTRSPMSLYDQRDHLKAEILRTRSAIAEQIEATKPWQWKKRADIESKGAADLERLESELASVKKNIAIAADQRSSKGLMSRKERQRLMKQGMKRGKK